MHHCVFRVCLFKVSSVCVWTKCLPYVFEQSVLHVCLFKMSFVCVWIKCLPCVFEQSIFHVCLFKMSFVCVWTKCLPCVFEQSVFHVCLFKVSFVCVCLVINSKRFYCPNSNVWWKIYVTISKALLENDASFTTTFADTTLDIDFVPNRIWYIVQWIVNLSLYDVITTKEVE